MNDINEDMAVNNVSSGNIAGAGVGPQGEPGIKKFAGSRVFKVPTKFFINARMMKSVIPTKNKDELPDLYWPDKKQMLVEEGDLLLFPSWLDHHTPAHTTGNLRVVVAMNIMLTFDNREGY